jgi:regulator of sigma E protease
VDQIPEAALSFTSSVLPLIVMLGVLVFVHELGHFIIAKWSGVKVLKFSLGFGPKIFGWTRGETEYVVSWIPLGGYVKMLGENPGEEIPPEDQGRTLTAKPLGQKVGIVFAGPAMNLVLPVLLFFCLALSGFPDVTALVGRVEPDSIAAQAGIAPGDRVLSINGSPARWWEEVAEAVNGHMGRPLVLEIDGAQGTREVTVVPRREEITTLLGDREEIGDIGISPAFKPAVAAVSGPGSPAGKAGVRTGDRIVSLGGRSVIRRREIAPALRAAPEAVDLTVLREGREVRLRMEVPAAVKGAEGLGEEALLDRAGFENPELFIRSVERHSPASEGGIEENDRLIAVGDVPIDSWETFTRAVLGSEGKPLSVRVRRNGEERALTVQPMLRVNRDPLAEESRTHYIGVGSLGGYAPGVLATRTERNPSKAFLLAIEESWRMTDLVLRGIWKLATGQVRMDNIGGPIQIGVVAAQAAEEGLTTFVRMMAFISINLGILNLLPIPILDGGHLLFFFIEAAKRGPISVRKKELAQQVGLAMLVLLIGVAFYNDIARSWNQIVGFLKDVGMRLM